MARPTLPPYHRAGGLPAGGRFTFRGRGTGLFSLSRGMHSRTAQGDRGLLSPILTAAAQDAPDGALGQPGAVRPVRRFPLLFRALRIRASSTTRSSCTGMPASVRARELREPPVSPRLQKTASPGSPERCGVTEARRCCVFPGLNGAKRPITSNTCRASRPSVIGVEDNRLSAELRELHRRAVVGGEREVGCGLPLGDHQDRC